jgi:hypothetical protein
MRFGAASASLVLAATLVSACGGGDASTSAHSGAVNNGGSLVASGFGQDGRYVWATALVHNDSDKVGQTVIVAFSAEDASGQVIRSTDQVEAFSRLGQDLAVGTQLDVGDSTRIATVEATLVVADEGVFSATPFPELTTGPVEIAPGTFGGWAANFELTNPTDRPLTIPRLGVVCHDSAGKIVGGGSSYPDFVPASGAAFVECRIITSGQPAGCEVFAAAPI